MALLENNINNFSVLFKRFIRRNKHVHTCRSILDVDTERHFYNYVSHSQTPLINCKSKQNQVLPSKKEWEKCATKSFFNISDSSKRKEFTGRKLIGFSMEEMFDVVNDVDCYKDFLPFCKKSTILVKRQDYMKADLMIGFPPVVEKYTSHVTYFRPNYILAESRDATLFNHLATNWKFSPGLSKNPRSCVISFYVSFEFKSVFHSHLANMFFNELVKQMESAFYTEAVRRYGKASIPTIKLKVSNESNSAPNSSSPSSLA